jgi:hypothetical protein
MESIQQNNSGSGKFIKIKAFPYTVSGRVSDPDSLFPEPDLDPDPAFLNDLNTNPDLDPDPRFRLPKIDIFFIKFAVLLSLARHK